MMVRLPSDDGQMATCIMLLHFFYPQKKPSENI